MAFRPRVPTAQEKKEEQARFDANMFRSPEALSAMQDLFGEDLRQHQTPIFNESGEATGQTYDPRWGQLPEQPTPSRYQIHRQYLESKYGGTYQPAAGEKVPGIPGELEPFNPVDPHESSGVLSSVGNLLAAGYGQSAVTGELEMALESLFGQAPQDQEADLFGLIDNNKMRAWQPNAAEQVLTPVFGMLADIPLLAGAALATGPLAAGVAGGAVRALAPGAAKALKALPAARAGLASKALSPTALRTALKAAEEGTRAARWMKVANTISSGTMQFGAYEGVLGLARGLQQEGLLPDKVLTGVAEGITHIPKGLVLGAGLSGGGVATKAGLAKAGARKFAQTAGAAATEIGVLGGLAPVLEGRAPTGQDFVNAAGFITSMKLGAGLFKLGKKAFDTETAAVQDKLIKAVESGEAPSDVVLKTLDEVVAANGREFNLGLLEQALKEGKDGQVIGTLGDFIVGDWQRAMLEPFLAMPIRLSSKFPKAAKKGKTTELKTARFNPVQGTIDLNMSTPSYWGGSILHEVVHKGQQIFQSLYDPQGKQALGTEGQAEKLGLRLAQGAKGKVTPERLARARLFGAKAWRSHLKKQGPVLAIPTSELSPGASALLGKRGDKAMYIVMSHGDAARLSKTTAEPVETTVGTMGIRRPVRPPQDISAEGYDQRLLYGDKGEGAIAGASTVKGKKQKPTFTLLHVGTTDPTKAAKYIADLAEVAVTKGAHLYARAEMLTPEIVTALRRRGWSAELIGEGKKNYILRRLTPEPGVGEGFTFRDLNAYEMMFGGRKPLPQIGYKAPPTARDKLINAARSYKSGLPSRPKGVPPVASAEGAGTVQKPSPVKAKTAPPKAAKLPESVAQAPVVASAVTEAVKARKARKTPPKASQEQAAEPSQKSSKPPEEPVLTAGTPLAEVHPELAKYVQRYNERIDYFDTPIEAVVRTALPNLPVGTKLNIIAQSRSRGAYTGGWLAEQPDGSIRELSYASVKLSARPGPTRELLKGRLVTSEEANAYGKAMGAYREQTGLGNLFGAARLITRGESAAKLTKEEIKQRRAEKRKLRKQLREPGSGYDRTVPDSEGHYINQEVMFLHPKSKTWIRGFIHSVGVPGESYLVQSLRGSGGLLRVEAPNVSTPQRTQGVRDYWTKIKRVPREQQAQVRRDAKEFTQLIESGDLLNVLSEVDAQRLMREYEQSLADALAQTRTGALGKRYQNIYAHERNRQVLEIISKHFGVDATDPVEKARLLPVIKQMLAEGRRLDTISEITGPASETFDMPFRTVGKKQEPNYVKYPPKPGRKWAVKAGQATELARHYIGRQVFVQLRHPDGSVQLHNLSDATNDVFRTVTPPTDHLWKIPYETFKNDFWAHPLAGLNWKEARFNWDAAIDAAMFETVISQKTGQPKQALRPFTLKQTTVPLASVRTKKLGKWTELDPGEGPQQIIKNVRFGLHYPDNKTPVWVAQLSDLLEWPALYDRYPHLKRLPVKMQFEDPTSISSWGFYTAASDYIALSLFPHMIGWQKRNLLQALVPNNKLFFEAVTEGDLAELRAALPSTLLHELTHKVQTGAGMFGTMFSVPLRTAARKIYWDSPHEVEARMANAAVGERINPEIHESVSPKRVWTSIVERAQGHLYDVPENVALDYKRITGKHLPVRGDSDLRGNTISFDELMVRRQNYLKDEAAAGRPGSVFRSIIEQAPELAAQVRQTVKGLEPVALYRAKNRLKSALGKKVIGMAQDYDYTAMKIRAAYMSILRDRGLFKLPVAQREQLTAARESGAATILDDVLDHIWETLRTIHPNIGRVERYISHILKDDIRQKMLDDLTKLEADIATHTGDEKALYQALLRSGLQTRKAVEFMTDTRMQIESLTKQMRYLPENSTRRAALQARIDRLQAQSGGKAMSYENAMKRLRSYLGQQTYHTDQPWFTKERHFELPDEYWERDAGRVMTYYINAVARDLADNMAFGRNRDKLNDLLRRMAYTDIEESKTANTIIQMVTGEFENANRLSPRTRKLVDWYVGFQVGTKIGLGTATFLNLFQPLISIFPHWGTYSTLRGFGDMLNPAVRKFVQKSGAVELMDELALMASVGYQPGGIMGKFAEKTLHLSGFRSVNRMLLYWAGATAKVGVEALHKEARGSGRAAELARKRLADLGVDWQRTLTEDTLLRAIYKFATTSQLQKSVLEEPLLLNHPKIRPFLLFKRFGIRQAALAKDMIWHEIRDNKNPMPAIRLAIAGGLGGAGVVWGLNALKSAATGQPVYRKDDSLLEWAVENMATIGSLGIISDMARIEDMSKLPSAVKWMVSPAMVNDASAVFDAYTRFMQDWKQYGDFFLAGERNLSKAAYPLGSLPRYVLTRTRTDTQDARRIRDLKGDEKKAIFELLLAGKGEAASARVRAWNEHYDKPQDKLNVADVDIRALRRYIERQAKLYGEARSEDLRQQVIYERERRAKLLAKLSQGSLTGYQLR